MIRKVLLLKLCWDAVEWLNCRQIRMAQYDLADDLYGHAGATCIGSCMPPQVMWSEMNTQNTTCFGNHLSRSLIAYGEYPLVRLHTLIPDVVPESVSESLGDEDECLLSSTLGVSEGQSPVIDI